MRQLRAKLKSSRGETLVETLAAILIASLSVAMLLGGVTVSVRLGRHADETDAYFYETLTAAETRQTPAPDAAGSPVVRITAGRTSIELPVQVYGGEGLYSYALDTGRGTGP